MTLDDVTEEITAVSVEIFNPETPFGGVQVYGVGDAPIQVEFNTGSPVQSVFGRIGAIVASCDDYAGCYAHLEAGLPIGGAPGEVLVKLSGESMDVGWSSAGAGSVTNFSAGDLAPLFTTEVADPTSTPALSFSLSNAGAHCFLGNNTGGSAPPAYVQPAFTDLSGSLALSQITDNSITFAKLQAASAASILIGRGEGSGAGNWQEITLGTNLSMAGTVLNASGGVSTVNVGRTLFVDAVNGNDGTGTRGRLDKPYLSIQAALNAAQAGDIVQIGPGTWDIGSVGTGTGRIVVPANVHVRGSGANLGNGNDVTIVKSDLIGTSSPFTGILVPGDNSVISDLAVISYKVGGGSAHTNAISRRVGAAESWTNVLIERCHLYGLADTVYAIGASLGDMTFIDCLIEGCNDVVMWGSPTTGTFINCIVRHTTLAEFPSAGAIGYYDQGVTNAKVKVYGGRYELRGATPTGGSQNPLAADTHIEAYDFVIDYGGLGPTGSGQDIASWSPNALFVSNVRRADNSPVTRYATNPVTELPGDESVRTVAQLPASPHIGQRASVSDGAAALSYGATVTGGGSTKYYVWYDGTNWKVVGGGSIAGGGNVSNSGTPVTDQLPIWTDATHIKGVTGLTGGSLGQVLKKNSATDYDWSWGAVTAGAAGSDKQVQFNDGGTNLGADADFTWDKTSNLLTLTNALPASTVGDSLLLINDTAATLGNPRYSPDLRFRGHNWDTNSGADKTSDYRIFNATVSGYNAYSTLNFDYQSGSGGYTNLMSLSSYNGGGLVLNFNGAGNAMALSFASNSAGFWNGSRGVTAAVSNTSSIAFGSNDVGLGSNVILGWTTAANTPNGTIDTALGRNAAGVLEINNGTAGQYRDLFLRKLIVGDTNNYIEKDAGSNLTLNQGSTVVATIGTFSPDGVRVDHGAFTGNGSVPTGGTTDQVLAKNSNNNYDLKWATAAGGGNVSNSGTPTTDQLPIWVDATHIKGVTGLTGGSLGQVLKKNSATDYDWSWGTVAGTGDVVGPASATDNAIARFDTATGKLIQNSLATIDDSGNLTANSFLPTGSGSSSFNSPVASNLGVSIQGVGEVMRWGAQVMMPTSMIFGWNFPPDTALARNSAGVLEINNGTAGQYRDLYARSVQTLAGSPSALNFGVIGNDFGIFLANGGIGNYVGIAIAATAHYLFGPNFTLFDKPIGFQATINAGGGPDVALERTGVGTLKVTDGGAGTGTITGNGTVPTGGTTDQVLAKNSNSNYDLKWATAAGGGNVSNSGTPVADQIAVWTDATHIKGVTGLLGGTTGQVLKKNSNTDYDWSWTTLSGGGNVTTAATLTAGRVILGNGGVDVTVDAGFTYASSTISLGTAAVASGGVKLFSDGGGSVIYGTPSIAGNINFTPPAATTNLAGTGGTGHVLKQTTLGGAITSGTLAASDVGLGNVTNDAQIKASDFPASSVDSEIALFSGTGGKSLKRATGSGLLTATSGVYGTVTAPSGTVVGTSDTQTLTNKRVTQRAVSQASSATWSPNGDTTDLFFIATAQATNVTTVNAPSGTPTDGQKLIFRIKCDATPRTITGWNAIYRFSSDMAAPADLVASKTLYLGFIYNSTDSKWDNVSQMNNF